MWSFYGKAPFSVEWKSCRPCGSSLVATLWCVATDIVFAGVDWRGHRMSCCSLLLSYKSVFWWGTRRMWAPSVGPLGQVVFQRRCPWFSWWCLAGGATYLFLLESVLWGAGCGSLVLCLFHVFHLLSVLIFKTGAASPAVRLFSCTGR